MMQIPNLPNPYMQVAQPQQPQSYNAVKIDVHNPSVIAPGAAQPAQQTSQYAQPTMPYYAYQTAPIYQYPAATTQPYYMPQQPIVIPPQVTGQQTSTPTAPQTPVSTEVTQPQVNVPQPVVTQPSTEEQKSAKTPQIESPVPLTPQIDLNAFIAK